MGQGLGTSLQSGIVIETMHPAPTLLAPAVSAPPQAGATAPGSAPEGVLHPKTIKSFVRRAGRTTTGQA